MGLGDRRDVPGCLGVAVIGCGSIGRLRAQILRAHPTVGYLAVCDTNAAKAAALARDCDADAWGADAAELIADPAVGAVIVATTEDAHLDPTFAALAAGKPVLVEKPLAILPADGERVLAAAETGAVPLYTGFTQRFRPRYLALKEHVDRGHLGRVTSARSSIYLTQAVADAVITRAPSTTPAINTLSYCIDLLLWCMPDRRPVTVFAQGGHGRFYEACGVPDSTWSVLTFDDGAVASLGVSWELPTFWPAYVATMEMELFGRDGVISIKDDHRDILLASAQPIPSPYNPDVAVNVAFLGSAMPGDWALGEYFGAMKDETYAFVASVAQGRQSAVLATGRQGQDVLRVACAIDESVRGRHVVSLRWPDGPPA